MDHALTWLRRHEDRLAADFDALLRIPSVSTDPAHAADVRRAAEWARDRMGAAGLDAGLVETPGHPVVVGRHHHHDAAPTLLVYAHYDVQPPDPLDEWTTPPFEPDVRDGRVYARGAADDKAQVVLQIAAAEAALATDSLPVNLLLVFEGEEEVGSPNLLPVVRDLAAEAPIHHAVIADSMMFSPTRPSVIFGMRGLAYLEVEVRTAGHDLHSGQYGGAVPNPAHVLARLIAGLHDADGRVAVPGFYDAVRPVDPSTRREWATLGWDQAAFAASTGGAELRGEEGWATHERLWIRPCLDVNGMHSGYTGPGKKTVLPAVARAKVSCRLVPDQEPDAVAAAVEAHLRSLAPPEATVRIRRLQGNRPWRADPSGPLYEAAGHALEAAFGEAPARVCHGGTLPIAPEIADHVTPSVAVMGFALPGANMHAPDEWIPLAQLRRGADAMVRLYHGLASG